MRSSASGRSKEHLAGGPERRARGVKAAPSFVPFMPLRYAGIRVTDLARSLRFYTKVLRLREVRRGDLRRQGLGIWVLLEDPRSHQRLELNWYPPRSSHATRYLAGEGLDHLGFLLGNVSAKRLESEYQRLLRGGARPTAVTPRVTGGWVAYVRDPNGLWIEIFRWPTAAERRKDQAERARRKRARARRRTTT